VSETNNEQSSVPAQHQRQIKAALFPEFAEWALNLAPNNSAPQAAKRGNPWLSLNVAHPYQGTIVCNLPSIDTWTDFLKKTGIFFWVE